MALSLALQGVQRLALDTVALIYAFERHPVHFVQIAPVIAAIDAGGLRGIVSSLALLETPLSLFGATGPEPRRALQGRLGCTNTCMATSWS